jgi:hypothetical protein
VAVLPVAAGPALYLAYRRVRSLVDDSWATVHAPTLLAFILPSVVALLVWMLRSARVLRRLGASGAGPLVMLGGALAGAGLGALLHSYGHSIPLTGDLPGTTLDCVLVGLPAGAAFAMFLYLPSQVARVARAKGWLDLPMTIRDGVVPALFVVLGTYLLSRMTAARGVGITGPGTPPSGWPVVFVTFAVVVVWVQAVAAIQGAMNEVAIGHEGEVRAFVEGRDEFESLPSAAALAAPAGGSE